jgi:biopolymer transport protein ExbB/TolQ
LDWTGHLSDQVNAFIADIQEALSDPEDRDVIRNRIRILDERRDYFDSFRFETAWNVARTGIEAYPLLGVLGTIFALWLAMRGRAEEAGAAVSEIVSRFSVAIDSTFAGLAMAVILMLVNSGVETLFNRIVENRRHVREVVLAAKRELMTPAGEDTPAIPVEG